VIARAARGEAPYRRLAAAIVGGWMAGIEDRLVAGDGSAGRAAAILSIVEGAMLLDQARPGTALEAMLFLARVLDGASDVSRITLRSSGTRNVRSFARELTVLTWVRQAAWMQIVSKTAVPGESMLQPMLARAAFHDSYAAPLRDAGLTPTEIFLRAARATPRWVGRLMDIRNAVVRRIGLQDVGGMADGAGRPASSYQVGDRLGIFTIFAMTAQELLLGIDDRHLDVRVSVLKAAGDGSMRYVVSTVVDVHNWLGHLYMLPVGRIHPVVVRAMMRRAVV